MAVAQLEIIHPNLPCRTRLRRGYRAGTFIGHGKNRYQGQTILIVKTEIQVQPIDMKGGNDHLPFEQRPILNGNACLPDGGDNHCIGIEHLNIQQTAAALHQRQIDISYNDLTGDLTINLVNEQTVE